MSEAVAATAAAGREWQDSEIFMIAGYATDNPRTLQTAICLAPSPTKAVRALQEADPQFAVVSHTSLAEFKRIVAAMEKAKHDRDLDGILIVERL